MKKSNNTGITLIALIITIIVLLILAAVTFTFVLGDNGIIQKASLAKEKTNLSQETENTNLKDLENVIENYQNETRTLGIQKELLYSNDEGWNGTNGDLVLSKPWTEYSTLMFMGRFTCEGDYIQVEYVPLELLNYGMKNNKSLFFSQYDIHYLNFELKDEKTFSFLGSRSANVQCVYYVYGIK